MIMLWTIVVVLVMWLLGVMVVLSLFQGRRV